MRLRRTLMQIDWDEINKIYDDKKPGVHIFSGNDDYLKIKFIYEEAFDHAWANQKGCGEIGKLICEYLTEKYPQFCERGKKDVLSHTLLNLCR